MLGGVIISLLCIRPQGSTPLTEGQTDGTCTTLLELQPVDPVNSEEEVVMETGTECTQMELRTGQTQGGAGGEEEAIRGDAAAAEGGGEGDEERESQCGGVEEEEDMEMMQSGGGEDEEEEEEKGDEVFERETMSQETHGQASCITSCVGEEQASPAPVVPLGWRRSQRKAKKTWKVKVTHLQAQRQKVKAQERGHARSLVSKNINSNERYLRNRSSFI